MGECFELEAGIGGRSQRATVTETGGTLRALSVDGISLVQDYPADSAAPFSAGWNLVPWPNRVAGGTWTHEGTTQRLPINEPERGHALHGLLADAAYRLVEQTPASLTLAADLRPQEGYPFELSTSVRYELHQDGLRVTHRLTNIGQRKAPVAVGTHPYLRLGEVPTEELKLVINADSHLEVDGVLIPTGEITAVHGTPRDYRAGQILGPMALDDVWTDFQRDVDGGSVHYLEAPDGSRVEMAMDAAFGYIQVYTTSDFPSADGNVNAVAMEPMTAPADAFNNGMGLRWLEPGGSWDVGWGIRHRRAPQEQE
ncbi:aldose 1-epimerase family protein [Paeniglutamicibacter kerguelensis]|uniref:Aldose 1-epimerase n=1 Tax=Paeniglutamicibacter kerguelensis TaxID=254788 RepID=A0ABS4XE52_9MICC|nr:aldose 1-epimerase family protein [Paeniglutamicibacter kerguelensis]MBP2386513.1 aldose 1-epimerase [Paeniglutamicibacter kerguelensis]